MTFPSKRLTMSGGSGVVPCVDRAMSPLPLSVRSPAVFRAREAHHLVGPEDLAVVGGDLRGPDVEVFVALRCVVVVPVGGDVADGGHGVFALGTQARAASWQRRCGRRCMPLSRLGL